MPAVTRIGAADRLRCGSSLSRRPSSRLAPAQPTSVDVRVVNTGTEPLDVVLRVAGLDAAGCAPVGRARALAPGATLTTTVHFALPAGDRRGRPPRRRRRCPAARAARVPGDPPSRWHARRRTCACASARPSRCRAAPGARRGRRPLPRQARRRPAQPGHRAGRACACGARARTSRSAFDRPQLTLPPGHSARVHGTVRTGGSRGAGPSGAPSSSPPRATPRRPPRPAATCSAACCRVGLTTVLAVLRRAGAVGHRPGVAQPPGARAGHGPRFGRHRARATASDRRDRTARIDGGAGGTGDGRHGRRRWRRRVAAAAVRWRRRRGRPAPARAGGHQGAHRGDRHRRRPGDRAGTQAVLDPISLGTTDDRPDQPTKLAAFTSVRHAAAPVVGHAAHVHRRRRPVPLQRHRHIARPVPADRLPPGLRRVQPGAADRRPQAERRGHGQARPRGRRARRRASSTDHGNVDRRGDDHGHGHRAAAAATTGTRAHGLVAAPAAVGPVVRPRRHVPARGTRRPRWPPSGCHRAAPRAGRPAGAVVDRRAAVLDGQRRRHRQLAARRRGHAGHLRRAHHQGLASPRPA